MNRNQDRNELFFGGIAESDYGFHRLLASVFLRLPAAIAKKFRPKFESEQTGLK